MKIQIVKEIDPSTAETFWVMVNDSYLGLSNCFSSERQAEKYLNKLVQLHNDNNLHELGKTVLKTITL
jgi:hypothetical protein